MNKEKGSLAIAIVILFVLFIVWCNPIAIVGVGERGVKVTLGRVSPQSYAEGVHFVTPFISKIKVMNVKTQKLSTPTEVYTKDIQQARISYVVNYNLMPNHVHEMYREVGMNYVDTILIPAIEGNIKEYAESFLHIFNNVREAPELIKVKNYYDSNEVTVYCELEAKDDLQKYLKAFGKIKSCERWK